MGAAPTAVTTMSEPSAMPLPALAGASSAAEAVPFASAAAEMPRSNIDRVRFLECVMSDFPISVAWARAISVQ